MGKFNLNWLTFPLFISIVIGVGLYLGYRLPVLFRLGELDLLTDYALFNIMVTFCNITIRANLIVKQVNPKQMYLTILFPFFSMFLFWFGSGYYWQLYASIIGLFTHLPFIWDSLRDIWCNVNNNTMTMPYGGTTTCYKTNPSELSSGGGGSSDGINNTGGGSSSTGGGSSAGASSTGGGSVSCTAHTASTNISDKDAFLDRMYEVVNQLKKDLEDDAFQLVGYNEHKAVKEIRQNFPVIDDKDVPKTVLPCLRFYNLKCKALMEHKIIETCGVKFPDSTAKPDLSVEWQKARLASVSEQCSEAMGKYYNTLPRV